MQHFNQSLEGEGSPPARECRFNTFVPTLEDEPLVSGNLYFAKICELQGSGSTGGSIAPDTFPFVSVESPDVYRAQPSALCTTERSWGMCGPALAALERRREAGIHPCHL